MATPLAWKQLRSQPSRTAVAVAGIAFAVILVLMQLGFRASLFESAVRYPKRLRYDVALFSAESSFIVRPASFPLRRLYHALGISGVESVSPVYVYQAVWKNPWTHEARNVLTLGVDPSDEVLVTPGVYENTPLVKRRDAVLFDEGSRPEHGPVADRLRAGERVEALVNDRRVDVVGLFEMGTSFGIDGSILTSHDNFLRLFPTRARSEIDVGLIRVSPGEDPVVVRDRIRAILPPDVLVLTKADFLARERAYWNATTPIGYVFSFGAVIGFVVGCIIVYQILFSDISDHLGEYATLKAVGASDWFLSRIVLEQAVLLALLGFGPGLAVSLWLYQTAGAATRLPIALTPERGVAVLGLTIGMCCLAGLIALRRVRAAEPAEVF